MNNNLSNLSALVNQVTTPKKLLGNYWLEGTLCVCSVPTKYAEDFVQQISNAIRDGVSFIKKELLFVNETDEQPVAIIQKINSSADYITHLTSKIEQKVVLVVSYNQRHDSELAELYSELIAKGYSIMHICAETDIPYELFNSATTAFKISECLKNPCLYFDLIKNKYAPFGSTSKVPVFSIENNSFRYGHEQYKSVANRPHHILLRIGNRSFYATTDMECIGEIKQTSNEVTFQSIVDDYVRAKNVKMSSIPLDYRESALWLNSWFSAMLGGRDEFYRLEFNDCKWFEVPASFKPPHNCFKADLLHHMNMWVRRQESVSAPIFS